MAKKLKPETKTSRRWLRVTLTQEELLAAGKLQADKSLELGVIRDWWQLGDRMAKGSLASIAKHLGLGEKTGSGKDFAALWVSDRKAAEAYLKQDVKLTVDIAEKLGVCA